MLVVDLRAVGFIDSAGLGVLVAANKRARREGRRLVLVKGPGPVANVLAVTGLDGALETTETPG